jgi:hypothetical protein
LLGVSPNIFFLGARPHSHIPAYLQHSDVILVPHRVSPFTESLDPIKAYECAVVGRPTVATPVAGFRELDGIVRVATSDEFCTAVRAALADGAAPVAPTVASWNSRAVDFLRVLEHARAAHRR